MEQIKELELDRLQLLADEYKNQGYEVIITPRSDQLPDFLRQFRPDLIARKGDESIVVEVKSRYSLSKNPQIREMARLLQGKKGWKFELVLVGIKEETRFTEGAQPLNEQEIADGMQQTRELLKAGFFEAALLYAWSATEGAIRLIAQKEEIEIKGPSSLHIIKRLATEGIISNSEYEVLMAAMKMRNAVAHGYRMIKYDPDIVEKLLNTTEGILKSQAIEEHA